MRFTAVLLAMLTLALVGCGATRLAIHRPAKPIYAVTGCHAVPFRGYFPPRHRVGRLWSIRCPGHFDARAVLGLTLGESESIAVAHGATVREFKRDGYEPMHTLDQEPNRIDVDTTDGIVTGIDQIG
jgi:hypothetical protein